MTDIKTPQGKVLSEADNNRLRLAEFMNKEIDLTINELNSLEPQTRKGRKALAEAHKALSMARMHIRQAHDAELQRAIKNGMKRL